MSRFKEAGKDADGSNDVRQPGTFKSRDEFNDLLPKTTLIKQPEAGTALGD